MCRSPGSHMACRWGVNLNCSTTGRCWRRCRRAGLSELLFRVNAGRAGGGETGIHQALLGEALHRGLVLGIGHGVGDLVPGAVALGLAGSYVTPLLVSTEAPSAFALFSYLLGVTGACYLTAWLRGWLWLAVAAATAAIGWGFAWLGLEWKPDSALPVALYAGGLAILALAFLTQRGTPAAKIDWTATAILAATSLLVLGLARINDYGTPSLALLGFFVVLLIGAASQRRSLITLAPAAAGLFLLYYAGWHVPELLGQSAMGSAVEPARNLITPPGLRPFLLVGVIFSGGIALAALWQLFDRAPHRLWAGVAALTPLLTFAYAYWRATEFTQSVPFGAAGLVGAALYATATEALNRRRSGAVADWSVGALAAASAAALSLAATMILSHGWLTVALAVLAPVLAAISLQRPIPMLRWLAAGLAGLVTLRLAYDPRIVGEELGTTPIINWLLYGYGIPALAFWYAARLLRQGKDDLTVMVAEGASIAFLTALITLEIRHLMTGGQVFTGTFTLAEAGLHASALLGLAVGLNISGGEHPRLVTHYAWQGLAALSLLLILWTLLFAQNPMFTEIPVGEGSFFNDLLLAYALPALLAALLYWRLRRYPPSIQSRLAGGTALVLAFAWLTLETTRLFKGPSLRFNLVTQELSYTYSAIWLVFAIALLSAGIVFKATALRHAAFAVLLLAVLKVFLLDMAGLTGLLRALSFIGLGLVLVGIGYAYQKLVFPKGPPIPASTANP